jgi:hypothetical protein
VIAKVKPDTIYARLSGGFAYTFVIVMVLSTLSIAVFLRDRTSVQRATWQAAGTAVACVFFLMALAVATLHFDLLVERTLG